MWKLLLFELILVLVVAGVWLLAPLIGITSVLWRVLIILVLVLPPIIVVLVKWWLERRAAKGLAGAMQDQGKEHQESVRPDRQEDIRILNDGFNAAISALKKSRLGGGKGTALYAMPWYMIIGPPAAGKSTALLRSGLQFPFTPGERKSVRGVGGTRNCDWWFSDQAILLDTAGRYATEDDDIEEWNAFLKMLKRYRKKRPLNGLMVAISIGDILTSDPTELDELAVQIRSRIDQVISELKLVLPVYIFLTKCDLMSGFVEYFPTCANRTGVRSSVLRSRLPDQQRTLKACCATNSEPSAPALSAEPLFDSPQPKRLTAPPSTSFHSNSLPRATRWCNS